MPSLFKTLQSIFFNSLASKNDARNLKTCTEQGQGTNRIVRKHICFCSCVFVLLFFLLRCFITIYFLALRERERERERGRERERERERERDGCRTGGKSSVFFFNLKFSCSHYDHKLLKLLIPRMLQEDSALAPPPPKPSPIRGRPSILNT